MTFNDFLHMGIKEFNRKLSSVPESEPLFKIIKSRTIKVSSIKNKEERKYWQRLKRANKIPQLYLSIEEIDQLLKEEISNGIGKTK